MATRLRVVDEHVTRSWWEALRDWDRWMAARGLAEGTRRTYRAGMVAVIVDLCIDPLALDEQGFIDYLASLPARGSKRDLVVKACRSFYSWAAARGMVPADPTTEITSRPHPQGDAPALDESELRAVLAAAFRKDRRRGWALMLAYATGAREGSLAGLEVADVHVDVDQPWIHFRVAKWNRPYSVPLGRTGTIAARALVAEAVAAGRSSLLGVKPKTIYDWAQQAGASAGIKCWAHLLRHTFATRLAEDPTVSPRTWMELMNHRDLSQYRRYARSRQHLLVAAMQSF